MKLTALIAFLTTTDFVNGWNSSVKIADGDFLQKQRFIFEIFYRVEDPLLFEEWIQLSDELIADKSAYTEYDSYMEKFWRSLKMGNLLPKGQFFGALVKSHHLEARGLFHFFYYSKSWEVFVRNVCWARMHVNQGMFAYALTLAVIHRKDCSGLVLPAVNEVFPQNFFTSKFIFDAEKFDYEVWSKFIMYKEKYHAAREQKNKSYHERKSKVWQWWKTLGLGNHWLMESKTIMRENIDELCQHLGWLDIMRTTKIWYKPIDYTRDIQILNDHTKLSYFTEDVSWNAYWYNLNMDYAFFLDGKTDRRGEYWLYSVQQILARYYMERLSNEMGAIPEFSWTHSHAYGYDPALISFSGISFSSRENDCTMQSYETLDYVPQIKSFLKRFDSLISTGLHRMFNGTVLDVHKPETIDHFGNFMQGNIDALDNQFQTNWYLLSHMYLSNVKYHDHNALPNVLLNFETMMRDPLFYSFHKTIADMYFQIKDHLSPYTREELLLPGVVIKEVNVDKLITYFDLVDFDVTNLLNEKVTFLNRKFVWDKALLARQMRLNHKQFSMRYLIKSDKPQRVVIRAFIGPKYDEVGRMIRLRENRQNFIRIDEFAYSLVEGENDFKRWDYEFFWTKEDHITYMELYKFVMLAIDKKFKLPFSIGDKHCSFPRRLLLPQGWANGMPMQMFFIVTEFNADWEQASNFNHQYSCGLGSGDRYIDDAAFGFPFDRDIDELNFSVPNMYFKNVDIFHESELFTH